jgi:hypothetical protein
MLIFACLFLVVGLGLVLGGVAQRSKAGRISAAPVVKTGELEKLGPSLKGEVAIEGAVQTVIEMAGASGRKFLYLDLEVNASWKEGEETKQKVIGTHKHAPQFIMNDGSGEVLVDPSKGVADFETKKRSLGQAECLEILQSFDQMAFLGIGRSAVQMMSSIPAGAEYSLTERFVLHANRMYACGTYDPEARALTGRRRDLLLSAKSRDQLLGSAQQLGQRLLVAGYAVAGAGGVLGIVGLLLRR